MIFGFPCSLLQGTKVSIKHFDTETEYTKPPDYLQVLTTRFIPGTPVQESELISLMDENGIGTDASIPQVWAV